MKSIFFKKRERMRRAYEAVSREIADGVKIEGLWLKAMSDAEFSPDKAKSIYVKLRVEQLMDEDRFTSGAQQTRPYAAPEERNTGPKGDRRNQPDLAALEAAPQPEGGTRRRFKFAKGLTWLTLSVAAFQTIDWAVFGANFTINPLEMISRASWSLSTMFDFGGFVGVIIAMQLLVTVALAWKGVRTLRGQSPGKNLG